MNLWNYGELLLDRGDLAGAEAAFLRAKRILEKVQADDQKLAETLHLLGKVAHGGSAKAARESLGLSKATFHRYMKGLGIARDAPGVPNLRLESVPTGSKLKPAS